MQIPVDCLGTCTCLILLTVLAHVLKLRHVLLDDWAMMHLCVAGCAALKSVCVKMMLKYNWSEMRLVLSTCLSASLNQDRGNSEF